MEKNNLSESTNIWSFSFEDYQIQMKAKKALEKN